MRDDFTSRAIGTVTVGDHTCGEGVEGENEDGSIAWFEHDCEGATGSEVTIHGREYEEDGETYDASVVICGVEVYAV